MACKSEGLKGHYKKLLTFVFRVVSTAIKSIM